MRVYYGNFSLLLIYIFKLLIFISAGYNIVLPITRAFCSSFQAHADIFIAPAFLQGPVFHLLYEEYGLFLSLAHNRGSIVRPADGSVAASTQAAFKEYDQVLFDRIFDYTKEDIDNFAFVYPPNNSYLYALHQDSLVSYNYKLDFLYAYKLVHLIIYSLDVHASADRKFDQGQDHGCGHIQEHQHERENENEHENGYYGLGCGHEYECVLFVCRDVWGKHLLLFYGPFLFLN